MKIIWKYLKPFRRWLWLAMALAGLAQVLTLIDPVIFGKIIDEYAVNPGGGTESEFMRGAVWWLAVTAQLHWGRGWPRRFQDYVLRLVVQKFGLQVFNDGLRHTLRLPYEEYEEAQRRHLAMLQKVRHDTENFINAFVNILFLGWSASSSSPGTRSPGTGC